MDRALEAKVLPPRLPEPVLPRRRIDPALDQVFRRRLTTVIAPSGFGKSITLAAWAERHECAWYTCGTDDRDLDAFFAGLLAALRVRVSGVAEALPHVAPGSELGPDAGEEEATRAVAHAARLCGVLQDRLDSDLVLVIDDLHELAPGSGPAHLVAAVVRQAPRRLHLVVLTREEPPFPTARLRAQGAAGDLDGALLAFDRREAHDLVTRMLGDDAPATLSEELYDATRGWPSAVGLALDAVRAGGRLPRTGLDPDEIIGVLAEEILDSLGPDTVALVERVAQLDDFSAGMCEELGLPEPAATIHTLERRGLAIPVADSRPPTHTLHPLVRIWARSRPLDADAQDRIVHTAARWLIEHDRAREGLQLSARSGDLDDLAAQLTRHGRAVIGRGGAEEVLTLLDQLAATSDLSADLLALDGEVRHLVGDWDGALASYERIRGAAGIPPAAAWRKVFIHHQHGDLEAALATADQCDRDGGDPHDLAMLDALTAAVCWLRGDFDECRRLAQRAQDMAEDAGSDRALAATHTAWAMLAAVDGDRRTNDAHYIRALTHAERAGDVHQLIRIHNNRGSRHLEEGAHAQALTELDLAIDRADLAGYATMRALALTNRGQVLACTGRLDEALRDLTTARLHYERVGAHMLAYPLTQIGDIHAARGEVAQARAAFAEATRIAEQSGDTQAGVPALVGSARLLAETDPEAAREAADDAIALGPTLGRPSALLARGWVALAMADPDGAEAHAAAATAAAGTNRDWAAVTGALELSAAASRDPERALELLREAALSWGRMGQVLDEARVRIRIAATTGATADECADGERAEKALRDAGVVRDLPAASDETDAAVRVRVLGGFEVWVADRLVGTGEWGSRKPRDLLKLLVASRGPVRRDAVAEALWPDQEPGRAARRISAALSNLRAVLDPDHALPPDHYVAADRQALWLVAEHWDVDLARFVDRAERALAAVEARSPDAARSLRQAEEAMGGEAFEEDAYAEWARLARDQVRALTIQCLRAMADVAARNDAPDRAVRLLLRLLQRDPYDEPAHQHLVEVLVGAGRHGEARRMYRTYCDRMAELGVEPAPYPF